MQINSRTKELEVPATFSPELADLMVRLLSKDPEMRPTAAEVIEHPFFLMGMPTELSE